jgi:hypothetical protein
MASEREKATYLEGHIGYEIVMLNYTFMRLMTARPSTQEEQLDINAYLESFGLHALNLIEFLCDTSRTDDHAASNYVPNFEPPDQAAIKRTLFRLEQQGRRAATPRTADPRDRFDVNEARELYAWIVPALLKFHGELAPSYRASLGTLGQVVTREPSEQ